MPQHALQAGLRLPLIVAPMFLVSTPEMVIAAMRSGVIGTCLAPNARTIEAFRDGLDRIVAARDAGSAAWAVSMIVHRSYDRFDAELDLVCEARPPLLISALGSPTRVIPRVHGYGGQVFTDVVSTTQARKAIDAGVDGLILLASGAGGHTGSYSAFAFVEEVRAFWDGPIVLGGAIGSARGIRAAIELGADFAYVGTRFMAARESLVGDDYRAMMIRSGMEDIVLSSAPTGLPANWLRDSLDASGFGEGGAKAKPKADFSTLRDEVKAWKNIWSAGQSVGRVGAVEGTAEIVAALAADYVALNSSNAASAWPRGG